MNASKSRIVYFYSDVSRARNNTGVSQFWCLWILHLLPWQNVLNFVIVLCYPSGYFFSIRRSHELIEHCSCSSVVVFRCLLCPSLFSLVAFKILCLYFWQFHNNMFQCSPIWLQPIWGSWASWIWCLFLSSGLGHLDGSTGWESNSWFWLRSQSRGHEIGPHVGLYTRCGVCLGFFPPLPLPLVTLSLSLCLIKINDKWIKS